MENINKMLEELSKKLDDNSDPYIKHFGFNVWQFISKEEIEVLITALYQKNPDFTSEEAEVVVKWLIASRVDHAMFKLVKKGLIDITVEDGQPAFGIKEHPFIIRDDV